jgi:hypothetical protein
MPPLFSFDTVALILFIGCLASHGLVLLNDGVYWDGWLIQGIYRQDDLKTMKQLTRQGGLIFFYYIHKFMSKLPRPIFFFKFFSFICLFLSSLVVFYLCRQTGMFTDKDALCISLLMLSYPGNHMTIEPCVIVYIFHLPAFFLACWLGLSAESAMGLPQFFMRIGAVFLFLISFNLNALLVYYSGFIMLLAISNIQAHGLDMAGTTRYMLSKSYYLALPFIYWFWKEKIYPRHGGYENYNKILFFDPKSIVKGIRALFRIGAVGVYAQAVAFIVKRPASWVSVALLVAAGIFFGDQTYFLPTMSVSKSIYVLLFGLLLLICGGAPYILIGQSFALRGWETKNNLLLALPMALIIFGMGQLVLPQAIFAVFVVFLVIAGIVYLNYCYLSLLAVYVKNRSILFNLGKMPSAKEISIFSVRDRHPIRFLCIGHTKERDAGFPEHRSAYLVYMFEYLWGDVTRFGINEITPRNQPWPTDKIKAMMRETTMDFAMKGIDINGRQASLIVRQGDQTLSEIRTAVNYLFYRLFKKEKLAEFLACVTQLELIPLK